MAWAGRQSTPEYSSAQVPSTIARGRERRDRPSYVDMGDGQFVGGQTKRRVEVGDGESGVTLNFVDVDIQEFVRAVFDEVLKENVVIDATLKGRVTVRTSGSISRSAARDLVRQALQANGASLVQSNGITRISARTDQKQSRRIGETLRLVQLKYIGAEEARLALGSFNQSGIEVTASPSGQFVAVAGAPADLDNVEEIIAALDVDQMKGMSFGLFALTEAGANAVSSELNVMFNKESDPRGFRAMPIARMNAVLVVTPKSHLMANVRKWLPRLDRADQDERKIYIYPVQNRRAVDIAKLLMTVVQADRSTQGDVSIQNVAPSLTPSSSERPSRSLGTTASIATARSSEVMETSERSDPRTDKARGPKISPDPATNSIVVTASPGEWKIIEGALRRLDVMASQVLIEATIAEVRLNDTLKHGVRWYLEKGFHSIGLGDDSGATSGSVFPGFNYSFGLPQARVVISALEQVSDVEIVSSPALTVLDNETAKLQVGDQVPISTRSSRSVVNPDAPTVNDIEMKDTGIILSVTPRVNASGLVMLDITQEVSDVVPTTTSNLNSPTIRQRKVNSSVAVKSGGEIVLGGLIGYSRTKANSGLPGLINVPMFGSLLSSQALRDSNKTELLVILRPTVMTSDRGIYNVTEEIKSRMQWLRNSARR